MAKQADKDIEIICDALTVRDMDMESRKRYSELILNMAAGPFVYRSQLTTCMEGNKNMLKQRFANILGTGKKRGIVLFTVVGIMIAATALTVGVNFADENSHTQYYVEEQYVGEYRNGIISEEGARAYAFLGELMLEKDATCRYQ